MNNYITKQLHHLSFNKTLYIDSIIQFTSPSLIHSISFASSEISGATKIQAFNDHWKNNILSFPI